MSRVIFYLVKIKLAINMAQRGSKSARWVFTVNNPGQWRPTWDVTAMAYMVWQVERGENGTTHIQGYVRFKNAKTLAAAKNGIVCQEAHMEQAEGTEEQCRDYCTKEETRVGATVEHGTYDKNKGVKGKRSDILAMTKTIQEGATLTAVMNAHPAEFIKFHAGVEKMINLTAMATAQGIREIHTTVLWGPTGTGKSHRIFHMYRDAAYVVLPGRDPFSTYSGQRVIVFEEFDYNAWPIQAMLRYLDKWPLQLDCRFNNKWAKYERVYILGNRDPAEWYHQHPQREALARRLTPPMGKEYLVESQDQDVDLTWWILGQAQAASVVPAPAPIPAPTPVPTPTWSPVATLPVQDQDGAGASTAPVLKRANARKIVYQVLSDDEVEEIEDPDEESQRN